MFSVLCSLNRGGFRRLPMPKKDLPDSSASKPLIYNGIFIFLADFVADSSAAFGRLLAAREQKWPFLGPYQKLPKSARALWNLRKHAGVGEKKPTGNPVGFSIWWSWGDLNPRPQAFFGQIYMFSGLI